uniref:DUF19 domain-containing protein n=1 Tax=Caenorhabditis tropicalis TaxID=1561998 RepID=A0A1I7UWE7_9PELO
MRIQLLSIFISIVSMILSVNASMLTVNATVGIGGTLPPVSNSNVTVPPTTVVPHLNLTVPIGNLTNATTTVAPLTTVTPHLNVTIAATTSNIPSVTTTVSSILNATKPTTKFPVTCQSLDVLEKSEQCYYALEGLNSQMGSSSLTDSITIELLNGYCDTFSNCYPSIEKCAEFEPISISIIKGFCDFYTFLTSRYFLTCAQIMEGMDTPCTDNATETILNFNATTAVRCAKLTAVSSCSVEEVGSWCNLRAVQNFQMFINRNIQTWMC